MRVHTLLLLASGAAAATTACGDTTGLTAYLDNDTATVSLYALGGTAVWLPSGYSIGSHSAVRTEQVLSFDFAFDIDTAGRPVLLPTGALKLGQQSGQSGLQLSTLPFDSIRVAPTTNYQRDSAVVIGDSSVVIAHSTPLTCPTSVNAITGVYYAKLLVLTVDTTSAPNGRRVDFRILYDLNCGYRGLELGKPKH